MNFSPFILNYGQQPRSSYAQKPKHRNPAALEFIEEMKSTQQVAKSALKMAAYDMKHFHDRKVRPPVKYQPGDLVLLEATNIRTERPSKKLNDKCYGPFQIIKKEGLASYHLKLDKTWRNIHPVFHVIQENSHHKRLNHHHLLK